MGVQRGMDRRGDWLWRPLKHGAGRGAGGVSAGRGGGVEVGGSGAMTRELWWGGRKEGREERKGTEECGGLGWWGIVLGSRSAVGPGSGHDPPARRTRLAGSGRAGLWGVACSGAGPL